MTRKQLDLQQTIILSGGIEDFSTDSFETSPTKFVLSFDLKAEEKMLYDYASHALTQGKDGKFRCQLDQEVLSQFDNYDLRPYLRDIQCSSLVIRGKESHPPSPHR